MERLFRTLLKSAAVASAVLLPASSYGTITMTVDSAVLYADANSTVEAPSTALLLLVADTLRDGFEDPTPGAFTSGDDTIIATWSYDEGSHVLANYVYSGDVGAQDPLRLYWYPTLSTSASSPGAPTPYGQYPNPNRPNVNDSTWVLPADGNSSAEIFMLTMARDGDLPEVYGAAEFTVVPEPGTWGLIAGAGCLAAGVITRRFRQRA